MRSFLDVSALVIEDNPLNLSVCNEALRALGLQNIKVASSAARAIEHCEANKVHLIVCSSSLTKGLSASQLLEELREKNLIGLDVVFISIDNQSSKEVVNRLYELQADIMVHSPINVKALKQAIVPVLSAKLDLKFIYDVVNQGRTKAALKLITGQLDKCIDVTLRPVLLKMKGDLLISTKDWPCAILFFRQVLRTDSFNWARLGLVNAYIKSDKLKHANIYLNQLLLHCETKATAYALLSELKLRSHEFKAAFEAIEISSELSPCNFHTQEELFNLSRLNHNYDSQLKASKEMLKLSKGTYHDCPEMYLRVIRTSIDHAMANFNEDQSQDIELSTLCMKRMKKRFPNSDLAEQVAVVNVRLHQLNNEPEKAKALMDDLLNDNHDQHGSIEDELDKAKACHQVGLFDHSKRIFAWIEQECMAQESDNLGLSEYILQESEERQRVTETPKELNNKAIRLYQKQRYGEAFEAFSEALTLLPDNSSIALNLLQTMKDTPNLDRTEVQVNNYITQCTEALANSRLNHNQQRKYKKLMSFIAAEDKPNSI